MQSHMVVERRPDASHNARMLAFDLSIPHMHAIELTTVSPPTPCPLALGHEHFMPALQFQPRLLSTSHIEISSKNASPPLLGFV